MSAAWDRARDVIAEVVDTECECGNHLDGHAIADRVMDALVINLGLHGVPHTHLDGRRASSLATDHIDEPVLSKENA